MKKVLFFVSFAIGVLAMSAVKANCQAYNNTMYHLITATSDYFDALDRYSNDPNADSRSLYDNWKKDVEKVLLKNMGVGIATTWTKQLHIDNVVSFTMTEASGNIGRSASVPYAVFTAQLMGAENQKIGYVCRNHDGYPVYVGKTTVSGEEAKIVFRLTTDGTRGYSVAVAVAIGTIETIELMTEEEFSNRELICVGPSYYKKGFAKVFLDGKADEVPSRVPGLYDVTVFESPEDDEGFTLYRMNMKKKNGETIASALYDPYDEWKIYMIEIYTPEIFILPMLDSYEGCVPMTICCDPEIIMHESRAKGIIVDEYYMSVPIIKYGVATFGNFNLKEEGEPGETFRAKDITSEKKKYSLSLYWN